MKQRDNKETERSLIAAGGLYLLAAMGLVLFAFGSGEMAGLLMKMAPGISQEWLTLIINLAADLIGRYFNKRRSL